MSDCGGHLAERGQALPFGDLALEPRVLFCEPTVFNRDRDLAGKNIQHGANISG